MHILEGNGTDIHLWFFLQNLSLVFFSQRWRDTRSLMILPIQSSCSLPAINTSFGGLANGTTLTLTHCLSVEP